MGQKLGTTGAGGLVAVAKIKNATNQLPSGTDKADYPAVI